MRKLHSPAYRLFALSSLSLTLAACGGGGAAFSTGGNPPPPPSKEFIFGDGDNSVLAFSVNTQTGVPTQISTVAGN